MAPFEVKTLYNGQAGTGYQIVFDSLRRLVHVVSKGGTMWVRPRFDTDAAGTMPTNPTPANGVVASWARLGDGDVLTLGSDYALVMESIGTDRIKFLDIWCEITGHLVATAGSRT